MKYALIKYHFSHGSKDDWHRDIARFIEAIENDPELRGKISYRAMKAGSDDYYHLATAFDQATADLLGERGFFDRYTARTGEVSGGKVEVIPLDIIAQTKELL
ncbi:MAG: hypothetical protein WA814_00470 [Candidatus Baltobacteraceae bacterium]